MVFPKMDNDWIDSLQNAVKTSVRSVAGNIPIIGDAAQQLMDNMGYEDYVAETFYSELLRELSKIVDESFKKMTVSREGGLIYPESGDDKKKYIVSRSIAAWLHSITSESAKPLPIKSLVIALLHERNWQCRDSKDLHKKYSLLSIFDGIREMSATVKKIETLAEEIRNYTIDKISGFEPAITYFNKCNKLSMSFYDYSKWMIQCDLLSEKDSLECVTLCASPTLLVEHYIDAISSDGNSNFYWFPFPSPIQTPSRKNPPMIRIAKIDGNLSPGYATTNIVHIAPTMFLNQTEFGRTSWPYGQEPEKAFIDLNPPFALWVDYGNNDRPEWLNENRSPDLITLYERENIPGYEEWDEYSECAKTPQLTTEL